MSTGSLIGRANPDGSVSYTHCHFDGHPEGVGTKLINHWTDPTRVDALIAQGSLLVLGSQIGGGPSLAADPDSEQDLCWTCEPDCGEGSAEPITAPSSLDYWRRSAKSGVEYLYLYRAGQWHISRPARAVASPSWRPVADVLVEAQS